MSHFLSQKRLLILGASDFQLPAILIAKQMGLYVGVADYNPNAVGIPYADEYFNVSTIDELQITNVAQKFSPDGILTLCTDMPIRALAHACEACNLPGPDTKTATIATDKGLMIKAFEKHGVSHPLFFIVPSTLIINIENYLKDLPFPIISKPTDNSGSRGVLLSHTPEQLQTALLYSSHNSRSGSVIIEEYMQGPEVSVEIMVVNGVPHVLQITDKLTTGAPHFVEIGHSQPSCLPHLIQEQIKELAQKAVYAIGYKNGAAHAEIIITKEGPKMVEIGARMGGGCITTHLVPLSTGINMTKSAIQVALGESPSLDAQFSKGAAIRFIIPTPGQITKISGKEDAKAIPGIQAVEIQCKVGQTISSLENGTNRIGYVIAQASTATEAIAICEQALNKISIDVN